jgi:hypothetical protein
VPVTSLEVLGTIRPDGTLELDQKLAVPPGRVRVRVEPVETPAAPAESLIEFVRRTRHELEAAGHQFRTREAIDTELAALRDEWDDRIDELGRLRESEREKPGC